MYIVFQPITVRCEMFSGLTNYPCAARLPVLVVVCDGIRAENGSIPPSYFGSFAPRRRENTITRLWSVFVPFVEQASELLEISAGRSKRGLTFTLSSVGKLTFVEKVWGGPFIIPCL